VARFAVGLVFGVVVGVVGGAALQLHAAEATGNGESLSAPEDDTSAAADIAPSPVPTPEPAYGKWDRLAICESGGDWHNARNPIYKGGLQFDAPTWARYGGLAFATRADYATRAQQILIAERTLAVQGPAAWPVCSRVTGLR